VLSHLPIALAITAAGAGMVSLIVVCVRLSGREFGLSRDREFDLEQEQRPGAGRDAAAAGARSLGAPGSRDSLLERRQRAEIQELKLALAEATVQLRTWQNGSEYVHMVPPPTSRP
jgi:hypothetical protein